MNDSLPTSSRPSAHVDHAHVVTTWLTAFEDALSAADESALANLIEKDGHWRDVLAFTWHLTPCKGAQSIARGLLDRRDSVEPRNFELSPERSSPRKVARLGRGVHRSHLSIQHPIWTGRRCCKTYRSRCG